MTTLHELEERILRLEKQNLALKRARKGLIVEPNLNILGQNTRINGSLNLAEITTPSTPASGQVSLYAKDGGLLYTKDDLGVESPIALGGVWQSWTPTPSGWVTLPNGQYRYCQIGKTVILSISMSSTNSTSNDTIARLSIPIQAASITGAYWRGANGYAVNNSSVITTATCWAIDNGTTSIVFYTNMSNGAWTGSGSKRVFCVATYEAD